MVVVILALAACVGLPVTAMYSVLWALSRWVGERRAEEESWLVLRDGEGEL